MYLMYVMYIMYTMYMYKRNRKEQEEAYVLKAKKSQENISKKFPSDKNSKPPTRPNKVWRKV